MFDFNLKKRNETQILEISTFDTQSKNIYKKQVKSHVSEINIVCF